MKDLQRERLPAARRAAVEPAGPWFFDHAITLLDLRNQLLDNRVAVRADVGGVDGVRVIEVRRGMLERRDDDAREVISQPVLRRCVASLFLETKWRSGREVSLVVENRLTDRGRLVVARQQHGCAEVDGASPELREHGALELEALHKARIGERRDRRNDVRRLEANTEWLRWIEVNFLYVTVDVVWRAAPVLSFPLVVVHPHRVAVGALELGVDVDERLRVVV